MNGTRCHSLSLSLSLSLSIMALRDAQALKIDIAAQKLGRQRRDAIVGEKAGVRRV
jgi:hypothetical protein